MKAHKGFIKCIFICVPKQNDSLIGLELLEYKSFMTVFIYGTNIPLR